MGCSEHEWLLLETLLQDGAVEMAQAEPHGLE